MPRLVYCTEHLLYKLQKVATIGSFKLQSNGKHRNISAKPIMILLSNSYKLIDVGIFMIYSFSTFKYAGFKAFIFFRSTPKWLKKRVLILSRSLSFERTFEKNAAYWILMPGSITMPSQCFDIFTVILKSAIIILFLVVCIRRG